MLDVILLLNLKIFSAWSKDISGIKLSANDLSIYPLKQADKGEAQDWEQ